MNVALKSEGITFEGSKLKKKQATATDGGEKDHREEEEEEEQGRRWPTEGVSLPCFSNSRVESSSICYCGPVLTQ